MWLAGQQEPDRSGFWAVSSDQVPSFPPPPPASTNWIASHRIPSSTFSDSCVTRRLDATSSASISSSQGMCTSSAFSDSCPLSQRIALANQLDPAAEHASRKSDQGLVSQPARFPFQSRQCSTLVPVLYPHERACKFEHATLPLPADAVPSAETLLFRQELLF
jgi:hypothetical protein